MIETILFIAGSIFIVWISVPSLRQPGSHGFYRFFAWEAILGMFLIEPARLVCPSVCLVSDRFVDSSLRIARSHHLRSLSSPPCREANRCTRSDYAIGSEWHLPLHPPPAIRFAALPGLGHLLQVPSLLDGCCAVVATAFLYATARADEAECLVKFGEEYTGYMKKTKMFIPFIF